MSVEPQQQVERNVNFNVTQMICGRERLKFIRQKILVSSEPSLPDFSWCNMYTQTGKKHAK
jgi:hypothetical protein